MNVSPDDLFQTSKSKPLKVYSDAGVAQDGFAASGYMIADHNGKPLTVEAEWIGRDIGVTQAEQSAIERVVEHLSKFDCVNHIKVYTDSKTIVEKCARIIKNYIAEYATIEWIPREKNHVADAMVSKQLSQERP